MSIHWEPECRNMPWTLICMLGFHLLAFWSLPVSLSWRREKIFSSLSALSFFLSCVCVCEGLQWKMTQGHTEESCIYNVKSPFNRQNIYQMFFLAFNPGFIWTHFSMRWIVACIHSLKSFGILQVEASFGSFCQKDWNWDNTADCPIMSFTIK